MSMTVKQYAEIINELAKKYPDAIVVYASDEEGNYFEPVGFAPAAGYFEADQFDSAVPKDQVNSVCIN